MAFVTDTIHEEGVAGPWFWAAAWSAAPGEQVSGDRHVVLHAGDCTILAVIDALGHGPKAAVVAGRAADALAVAATACDTRALARACHTALRDTRGAVLTVAIHDSHAGSLELLAVGNVEGELHGGEAVEHTCNAPGIVGHNLPQLHPRRMPAAPGDVLVLATDGIDAGFGATVRASTRSVSGAARRVIETHRRGNDDALVLVARLDGEA